MSFGPHASLDDFIWARHEELYTYGGVVQQADFLVVFDVVTLLAIVTFGEFDAGFLRIFEANYADDFDLRKYAYQAMYADEQLFRYCYDPIGHSDMPLHRHGIGDEKEVWGEVACRDAVEELWPLVVERDEDSKQLSRSEI